MTSTDDLSARLTVLETVVRQLVTHMAVRNDDPSGWVRTRKVLALRAVDGAGPAREPESAPLREAVAGFFEPVEDVAAAYQPDATPEESPR